MKRVNQKFRYLWLFTFTFLLLTASLTFVQAGGKKREKLNQKFRSIAEEMKTAYGNGNLDQVIDLYKEKCSGKEKKKFKKVTHDIRAEIYRLVALSYYALDKPERGDYSLRKLLVLRRQEGTDKYWLSIRNTAREKYYVAPRLLVGFSTGINLTMAQPFGRYSVLEFVSEEKGAPYAKDYPLDFNRSRGVHIGLNVEYALSKHFWLCFPPSLTNLKFQYEYTLRYEGGKPKFTYKPLQRVRCIEIPLLLKYHFAPAARWKPYLQAGGYFRFVTSATKDVYLYLIDFDGTDVGELLWDKDLSIKSRLTRAQVGLWLGAGVGFGIEAGGMKLEVSLEINYKHGLDNIVNTGNRWGYDNLQDDRLLYYHYDVFDDMKLDHLELGLKISLPISFKAFKN
jgi:hypothetical protein